MYEDRYQDLLGGDPTLPRPLFGPAPAITPGSQTLTQQMPVPAAPMIPKRKTSKQRNADVINETQRRAAELLANQAQLEKALQTYKGAVDPEKLRARLEEARNRIDMAKGYALSPDSTEIVRDYGPDGTLKGMAKDAVQGAVDMVPFGDMVEGLTPAIQGGQDPLFDRVLDQAMKARELYKQRPFETNRSVLGGGPLREGIKIKGLENIIGEIPANPMDAIRYVTEAKALGKILHSGWDLGKKAVGAATKAIKPAARYGGKVVEKAVHHAPPVERLPGVMGTMFGETPVTKEVNPNSLLGTIERRGIKATERAIEQDAQAALSARAAKAAKAAQAGEGALADVGAAEKSLGTQAEKAGLQTTEQQTHHRFSEVKNEKDKEEKSYTKGTEEDKKKIKADIRKRLGLN